MRRNLIFILAVAVVTMMMMAAGRILFIISFAELASECTAQELVTAFLQGFKLDITATGYIAAPVVLILWAGVFLKCSFRTTLNVYLTIAAVTVSLLFTANLVMYRYWAFPIDASVLQYLESPTAVLQSVTWVEVLESTGIFALHLAILEYLYLKCSALYSCNIGRSSRWFWSIVMLLVAGADFLAIRGGTSPAVANISKVFFSSNPFLNHAAVNPTFSFASSLKFDAASEYRFYSDEQCLRNFLTIRSREAGITTPILRREVTRPDIVMVVAESFGTSTITAVVDGRPVAPGFTGLCREGVYFSSAVASSFRTDRGVVATLSGFPAQTMTSIMKDPAKSRRLPSIASVLSGLGYATAYIHGGDLNFTDMSSYLYGTGFEKLEDIRSIAMDSPKGKWGYRDDVMGRYFAGRVKEMQSPFMAVWQTLSSHEPFDCPDMGFEDRMLNSMAFADREITGLVESLRQSDKWSNMVVVIVADHAFAYPYGIAASSLERHRIPILITGGAVEGRIVIDRFMSQTDLAATLLEAIGVDSSAFPFSRNALGPLPTFGYWVFNNGFGVADGDGYTVFDCTGGKVIDGEDSATRLMEGKTMLQTTYAKINAL